MVYEENTLLRSGGEIYRILSSHKEEVLVINCLRRTMPCWRSQEEFSESIVVAENELLEANKQSEDMLASYDSAQAHKRFTVIAGILPVIGDKNLRSMRIREAADFFGVSRQTIRKYLCDYLIFQDIRVLALVKPAQARELTADEKTMRWALNKYYYNPQKLALTRVYERMIRERYTSDEGIVMEDHPSIYQFRRFQKKYEKLQTKIISRQGIKDYQRNHRPLLGDGVQSFAPAAGWAMLDGTVCDIYLINDQGELVGRPELTAAVDVYSGMCIGYSLGWEGGVHSLRGLMMNILVDKQDYCRHFGITLAEHEWPVNGVLPGTVVTDMGTEYTSGTFEHLSELGVTIINLESYRPELKGPIEKFFDVVQELYKPDLKGFGVIEPDYQERGAHDYRKDACLTLREFETILIRCIIHYNAHRIVEEFPFTEEMLKREVDPYSNEIFLYGRTLSGTHQRDNRLYESGIVDDELLKHLFNAEFFLSNIVSTNSKTMDQRKSLVQIDQDPESWNAWVSIGNCKPRAYSKALIEVGYSFSNWHRNGDEVEADFGAGSGELYTVIPDIKFYYGVRDNKVIYTGLYTDNKNLFKSNSFKQYCSAITQAYHSEFKNNEVTLSLPAENSWEIASYCIDNPGKYIAENIRITVIEDVDHSYYNYNIEY